MEFETRIIKTKFIHELQENSARKNSDSLHSRITSSTFSPKKSKRSIEKRVITVSIKDVEGSRQKGEIMSNPPSDSWAWRKYGQKPIKGSPYPRGYYKCSSSKGCPARKQVEKSREDPNLLVLAYYWEHNHPCPPPRNYNNHQFNKNNQTPDHQGTSTTTTTTNSEEDDEEQEQEQEIADDCQKLISQSSEQNNIISNSGNGTNDDYGLWFSDYDYGGGGGGTYSTALEIPIFGFEEKLVSSYADDIIRDDDEAIFADLGELPECSTVFRRRTIEIEEERRRRQSLTVPYCGTT